ncbi:MAG: divergent PAP2 family protein [Candidatus Peribacteraceae bacterium]|nr:divergent PAP2 family protein [Candidatus Peribacteraceae bacterium]MBP9850472.1 divergent PAP2 family protein [Candidatus Peribacteraceae bacterium]
MYSFLSTYVFVIPLIVGLLSEALKIFTEGVARGAWHEGLFRPGGMPSSHSAFVTSLLIVVATKSGLDSVAFAIAFVFASIVWYDAMSSRRAIGQQAELLNRLQKWVHLSERLGHSFLEVIGGIVFGACITWIGIYFMN